MAINDGILIALIGGFVSVITILLKYRIENKESIKNIKEIVSLVARHNDEQDKIIREINNKLETINDIVSSSQKNSDIKNKILFKFFEMQFDLNKVIINDIKNGKHNGDLTEAELKIANFKAIVEDKEIKKLLN